jgi:hypothetical protein
MKKLYLISVILMFSTSLVNAEEVKCETIMENVNPACSKLLKGAGDKVGGVFGKLKKFSSKHQTIGQTLNGGVIKEKKEKKKRRTLKEFSEDNQKIDVKGILKKF